MKTPFKAFLICPYLVAKEQAMAQEHLEELALLTATFGAEVVGQAICFLRRKDAATFLTEGKAHEMVELARAAGATLVIFDEEITPSQQRNLEKLFGMPVIDRAELILEVFGQRAQTKEARLQIELAKAQYQAPRLKRLWTHLSRQQGTAGGGGGGGGGYLKGEGEKQIEIDRRILKKTIDELREQIRHVRAHRQQQRAMRERREVPTFALIGYTNAGKSTLMHALTQADVLVEDKLFATLDTTTRRFALPNNQEVLITDTVGFIRKLPHQLVAAFKSTLEEALYADILIHLIDVSHPAAEHQAATTLAVLKELGAHEQPILTVLNKVDLLENRALVTKFRLLYPHTLVISARQGEGIDQLIERMAKEIQQRRRQVWLRIPQSEYTVVGQAMRGGEVQGIEYEENDVLLHVELPFVLAEKLKPYVISPPS